MINDKIIIQGLLENAINANASQSFFKFRIERDGDGGGNFTSLRVGGVDAMAEMLEIMINSDQVFNDAFFLVASENQPQKVGQLVEEKILNGIIEYDI